MRQFSVDPPDDDPDGDAVQNEPEPCPACGGDLLPLGQLGNRLHLRCRQCGAGFSHEVRWAPSVPPRKADPEEPPF